MHPNLLIVISLTIGFTLASLFAYVMQCLRLPSILGYLLAGYMIGPYFPGFVADHNVADQLAEIGVILMLFGVGLHFKIEDLVRVKNIAIPGAVGQTLIATIFTTIIVYNLGWSVQAGIIIGLCVGVASTVVLVRLLTDKKILNTPKGHIAVGWLVVEDIFTVIILLLLPTVAALSSGVTFSIVSVGGEILFLATKFCVLVLFMFTWGHKCIDYILTNIARMRSQELFTLTLIALVFLIATGSSVVFGTSIALGAFIAGMVVGKTTLKHQAAANALPLKDIFAVIFFLSVGMLFNPVAMVSHFTLFIGIISVILIVKPVVAYLITVFLGYSLNTALTIAISLAQIGEFSFILAEEAMNLKLIPDEGFDILVACALISISINPLLFLMIKPLESFIHKFTFFKKTENESFEKIVEHNKMLLKVLIVGYGPIGKAVTKIALDSGFVPIIIEQNIDTVSNMEEQHKILYGDSTDYNILKDALIEKANYLLITIPEITKIVKTVHAARHANPNIQIITRLQYIIEKPLLDELGVKYVCTESEALKAFTSLTRQLLDSNNHRAPD
ncbi:MAG: cation:proton antiporter [Parachlamydiaceae bacterium]|nr:cation:proton antiporter [Parachlamydiaceae bacterium]